MTKDPQSPIPDNGWSDLDLLIRKQLFYAWSLGKRQHEDPEHYNLDTDHVGQPIYDAIKSLLHTAIEEERKQFVEDLKDLNILHQSNVMPLWKYPSIEMHKRVDTLIAKYSPSGKEAT